MKDRIFIGDRYEVLSKVGAGGMADVYKGKDHKLNRFVAIKILKKEYREDEMFVRKFQSEAQAAAGLMHPNIVNVYDVGEEHGLYYMVMELVEGITLKEYINKKGRLSAKETISIAIQAANGIEAAHMHNIVHRDIKPQNIIISKEGKVKVTDFGIAKATSSNTISTNALGSVHYTSPEQARGGFSDFKSDIYSLGITLYEMVTGQVPFDGDSAVSIAIKHLQEEIMPPSEYVDHIPYSLEQIILKCTQKNADRRYLDINALKDDLKRSLVEPEGDFVVIGPMKVMDETILFSSDDVNKIQREAKRGVRDEYDDDYYEEDYEDDDYDDEDDEEYGERKREKNDDMNPRMAKIMRILTIVAVVIIIFVMLFIVGKATGLLKFGPSLSTEEEKKDEVKVPNIVGKTEEEAKKALDKYDLGISVKSREESTKYEEGKIIEQTPESGKKVKKKTTVTVIISSGKVAEEKEVPNVSGKSQSDAIKELEDAGFVPKVSGYETSTEFGKDEVISTNPAGGTMAPEGSEVGMLLSSGEDKPTIPEVVGKSRSDAESQLSQLGLLVTVEEEYNDSYGEGMVFYQSKAAGTRVPEGTTIVIKVSKGKKPVEKVTVPPVKGKSQSTAEKLLREAGLTWEVIRYEDNALEAGTVISASPTGKVDPGTKIGLVISNGPAQNETPPDTGNEGNEEDGGEGEVQQ